MLFCVCADASRCLTPPTSGEERARVLSEAWCVCGDVHCLSTKLPSTPSTTLTHSLSSHMEEFELKKPEDESIITMATSIRSPSENEEACLKLHSDIETSLLKRWVPLIQGGFCLQGDKLTQLSWHHRLLLYVCISAR